MISDWDILARARSGDEAAWRLLIDRHRSRLLKMTLLITKSAAAAQDLTQDSFLRLLRAKIKHRDGSFSGYLSTIAYRLALKEKHRASRQSDLDGVNPADPAANPLDSLLRRERDRSIADAIVSLSDRHRDVLVLRFYGENSYEEIAEILDLPLGTVKSRIFYAVKACQQSLRKEGVVA